MKQLKKMIKLTNLSLENLNVKELNHAQGGSRCHCGCFWAACSGSSRSSNSNANTTHDPPFVSPLPPVDVEAGIL